MNNSKFRRLAIIAILINLLALAAIIAASFAIPIISPSRPPLNDLLFELTPYIPLAGYLTQIVLALTAIVTTHYAFSNKGISLPQIIAAIGTMEFIRALILVLTPLGLPAQEIVNINTPLAAYGPFPSGHTAFVFLCYLFIDKNDIKTKTTLLFLLFGEITFLILSRGHYSIDIVGGLLLGYAVYQIFTTRKWFEINPKTTQKQPSEKHSRKHLRQQ